MGVAAPTAAMPAAHAAFFAGGGFARAGRGEGGKLLGDFRGTTARAFRPFPVGGTDEDFGIVFALFAVKFVDWHGGKITGISGSSSVVWAFAVSFNGRR